MRKLLLIFILVLYIISCKSEQNSFEKSAGTGETGETRKTKKNNTFNQAIFGKSTFEK